MKQNPNAVSRRLIAAALFAFIGAGSAYAVTVPEPIRIGALLSLTGNWSSLGLMSQTLLGMAKHDVNHYLAAHGSLKRVDLLVRDTRLDPDRALEKFQQLIDQNVVAVVGPQSSSEVARLKPLADAKKRPLLSQGSTASSLAFVNDMVYRLVPDDSHESAAMLALLKARQVEVVIPVWRNDAGNNGLQQSLKKQFVAAGGSMLPGVRYDVDTADFTGVVADLQTQLASALQNHDVATVAIYLAGFDEVVSLFHAADTIAALKNIKWYGSDGVALSAALLNDATAAQFAAAVDYPNPIPGLSLTAKEKWQALSNRVFAKTGQRPDAFALAAYDAFWIAALNASYNKNAERNADQDILSQTADLYFGATGWTELNRAGDRQHGDYDFWALRANAGGVLQWVEVCRYEVTSGPEALSCSE
ncbi:MAG: ABC transporter substrate-binding protein [Methylovulum sp.]|nr:ABC transporter substrate-binding protein [Methylovulum sp.]